MLEPSLPLEPAPPPNPKAQPSDGQPASGLSSWIIPPPAAVSTRPAGPAGPAGPAPGYAYAGFWRRFWAYLADWLIVGVPIGILALPVISGLARLPIGAYLSTRTFDPVTQQYIADPIFLARLNDALARLLPQVGLLVAASLVIQFVYFGLCWSRRGATLGQQLLGVEVRHVETGRRISFGRACLRFIGYSVSGFFLDAGFVWVAFDARKQGWHDKIANTVAIRSTGPRTTRFPYWILGTVVVLALIAGSGFSAVMGELASVVPPAPGSAPIIQPGSAPPVGSIWFGTDYDKQTFALSNQGTTFPRASSIVMIASLVRVVRSGEIVTTYSVVDDNARLIDSFKSLHNADVIAEYVKASALSCTCSITIEMRDSAGNVLARSAISLT
jgi:uncharacterized RDD family membrane protein YckC